jgi:CheY-like chemotaxis protein
MNKTILVIEDAESAARLLKDLLEGEGYRVICETNGISGLRRVQKEKPDLVILDILVPGIDGFQMCQILRRFPQTSRLPIVILSAKAAGHDVTKGLLCGANVYLRKPADPFTIMETVNQLIQKYEKVPA